MKRDMLSMIDASVADVVRSEHTWLGRWRALVGVMQGIATVAIAEGDDDPRGTALQMGPEYVARVIRALGTPAITDVHQAAFYRLSNDPEHLAASRAWRAANPTAAQWIDAGMPGMPSGPPVLDRRERRRVDRFPKRLS
jgi:hypothetical protein